METLIEVFVTLVLDLLQEIWPPILAVITGALVLCMGFLTYLFYTTAQPVKAVGSLVAAVLFLVAFFVELKSGVYTRRTTGKKQHGRRSRRK